MTAANGKQNDPSAARRSPRARPRCGCQTTSPRATVRSPAPDPLGPLACGADPDELSGAGRARA